MMTSVGGNIFQGSGRTSYTLMFGDLGPWIDTGGRPCYLVSIDARGVLHFELMVNGQRVNPHRP